VRMFFLLLLSVTAAWLAPRAARADESSKRSWFGLGSSSQTAVKTTNVSNTTSPSVFSGVTNGTKNLMSGTKNLLTPKKKAPVRKSGLTATHSINTPPAMKPGTFSSWFNNEPPPPPRTIKEWMALKQIHP
jgi:hypothetical protein